MRVAVMASSYILSVPDELALKIAAAVAMSAGRSRSPGQSSSLPANSDPDDMDTATSHSDKNEAVLDLMNLRLVCKKLNRIATDVLAKERFSERCIILADPRSLEVAQGISKHPVFSHAIKKIRFALDHVHGGMKEAINDAAVLEHYEVVKHRQENAVEDYNSVNKLAKILKALPRLQAAAIGGRKEFQAQNTIENETTLQLAGTFDPSRPESVIFTQNAIALIIGALSRSGVSLSIFQADVGLGVDTTTIPSEESRVAIDPCLLNHLSHPMAAELQAHPIKASTMRLKLTGGDGNHQKEAISPARSIIAFTSLFIHIQELRLYFSPCMGNNQADMVWSGLRLPCLQSLSLSQLGCFPESLMELLRNHDMTLRRLTLQGVQLKLDDQSASGLPWSPISSTSWSLTL